MHWASKTDLITKICMKNFAVCFLLVNVSSALFLPYVLGMRWRLQSLTRRCASSAFRTGCPRMPSANPTLC